MKRVYDFEEGHRGMVSLLGGKGAGLSEMTNLGIRVPPGFTITTGTCMEFFRSGGEFPPGLWDEVLEHVRRLEEKTGRSSAPGRIPYWSRSGAGPPSPCPG
jgi:pyruvate,orthophosphate dikinase